MSKSSSSSSIGFSGLLTIVFITLKLIGKIDWSWWWVLSPLWISVALSFAVFAITYVCIAIARKNETPLERSIRKIRESSR